MDNEFTSTFVIVFFGHSLSIQTLKHAGRKNVLQRYLQDLITFLDGDGRRRLGYHSALFSGLAKNRLGVVQRPVSA